MAGIGCHFMSQWMNRNTSLHIWAQRGKLIGMSNFVEDKHIFQKGYGTYNHQITTIRAAVASKVNITYKILYNNAVAMTEDSLSMELYSWGITHQLYGEGVSKIALVTDDPVSTKIKILFVYN